MLTFCSFFGCGSLAILKQLVHNACITGLSLFIVEIPVDLPSQITSLWLSLLDQQELSRFSRRAKKAAKLEFLVSHGLLRLILSVYLDIPPASIIFEIGKNGRPELKAENSVTFNMSHSGGWVAIGVTRNNLIKLGVDIELIDQTTQSLKVAKRFFSKYEWDQLNRLSGQQQQRRFFELWVLKESFVKAIGKGITWPLDQFYFDFSRDNEIVFSDLSKKGKSQQAWQFKLLEPVENVMCGVACQHPETDSFSIQIFEIYLTKEYPRYSNLACFIDDIQPLVPKKPF